MFYEPIYLLTRYHKVVTELDALSVVYGDFKILNSTMGTERKGVRRVIDDLHAEKLQIEKAFRTLEMVKL